MATQRDSQRQKVYDAERIAFEHDFKLQKRYDVGGIEGAQAIVDKVFASQFMLAKYKPAKPSPTVVAGVGQRRRGCYRYSTNEIHLPEWARQNWYVLHEVAHALTPTAKGRDGQAPHGQKFAECYLLLVRLYMGRHYSDRLEAAFKTKNVKYKPKRAYTISDEERARRSERAKNLAAQRRLIA